ncbi:hypothetical protein GCM10009616_10850 [Microlunatus lacustris]
MSSTEDLSRDILPRAAALGCPPWCVTGHGVHLGEEDWLHCSEPLPLTDGVAAQLCLSIDPTTRTEDGPYLVVGSTEYSLEDAQALALRLLTLASTGSDRLGVPTV